ncbi:location of vulva defective 1-like [Haliotis rubra]|uniref:location of vulva defective 1-like n=1 Tax=Haliotis rubra TaxID=36100 RepID=UPI001EE4F8C8|nr:location of vulva defective 1-like [Haliotis rubra]
MEMLKISSLLCLILAYTNGDIGYTCSDGFTYLASTKLCYKYIDDQVTKNTAEGMCENIFAVLVEVTSFDVEALIKQRRQIDGDDASSVWLGMTRSGSTWKWFDLDKPVSNGYTNWAASQPVGVYSCAVMAGTSSKWTTHDCTSNAGGIACQRQPDLKTDATNLALEAETKIMHDVNGAVAVDGEQKLDISSCTDNASFNNYYIIIDLGQNSSLTHIGLFAKYPVENTTVHFSTTCTDRDDCWSKCIVASHRRRTQWINTCAAGHSNKAHFIRLVFPNFQSISICEIIVLGASAAPTTTTPTTTTTTTTMPSTTSTTTTPTTTSTTTTPTTTSTTTTPTTTSTTTTPTTTSTTTTTPTTTSTTTTPSTTSTTTTPTTTSTSTTPTTTTYTSTTTASTTTATITAALTTTTSVPVTTIATGSPLISTTTSDAVTTVHPDGQVLAWDSYGRAIRKKCTCRCKPPAVPKVEKEAVERGDELKDELIVEAGLLSTEIAKKISKQDDRKSSNVIGMSGIAMLILPILFIVIPDLLTFLKWLCRC